MSQPTLLCELAIKYGTDKVPFLTKGEYRTHGYTPYYHELFADRRNNVKRVLEIGVAGGASLRMWEEYFPNAEIFGLDNNPLCLDKDYSLQGRIRTAWTDQSNASHLRSAVAELGLGEKYDLIVEDGSHREADQILTATTLVPYLAPNGIYIIEDLCHPELVVQHIPYPVEVRDFRLNLLSDDRIGIIRA